MRQFDYKKLAKRQWDNEIVLLCSKIHECKGRQELFIRQKPAQLDRLIEIAVIKKLLPYSELWIFTGVYSNSECHLSYVPW